jgi:hypothetical protein
MNLQVMKSTLLILMFSATLLTACGENSYDKHTEAGEAPAGDSSTGFQAGEGIESIADPNAANTKRTPVPLDSVVVDTTHPEQR